MVPLRSFFIWANGRQLFYNQDWGRVASHPTTETFRKPIHRALASGLFMEVADHPGVGRLGRHCRPSRSAVDWLAT